MSCIIMRPVTMEDIPTWIALSNEYDDYVGELVPDLTQWYEGNKVDIAFADYTKAKIQQHEAFMAIEEKTKNCLGIVAFSRKNNRITFFGVSHTADFRFIGNMLMTYALNQLNDQFEIAINVLKSNAPQMENVRELLKKYGFTCVGSELENGVPVNIMLKLPL